MGYFTVRKASLVLFLVLRFRDNGVVVGPEQPCEGAARLLDLIHEELVRLVVVVGWPGAHVPIVDVPRSDLRVDQLVSLLGLLGPELAISASSHVLEVQPLVAELARRQVSDELDLGDFERLGVWCVDGEHIENGRARRADLHQALVPHPTVSLLVLVSLEVARELNLPGHPHLVFGQLGSRRVRVCNVTDCGGEGPLGTLNQLFLDGVDEALVVLARGVRGLEGVDAAPHGALEEVPRVRLLEARHAEHVLRLGAVDEELKGHRGQQALGLLVEVRRLREANDVVVGLLSVKAGIVAGDRDPGELGDEALLMCRLDSPLLHLVGVLAEGTVRLVREDLVELVPERLDHGRVLRDHRPEVVHLVFFRLALVCFFLEVANFVHRIRGAITGAGATGGRRTLPLILSLLAFLIGVYTDRDIDSVGQSGHANAQNSSLAQKHF